MDLGENREQLLLEGELLPVLVASMDWGFTLRVDLLPIVAVLEGVVG